jgi:hypothetical protein
MDKHTQKTSSRSLTGDEELKVEAGPPKSGSERLSFGSAGKSVVRGDAMAHELGHLLLGVSSHAPRGVSNGFIVGYLWTMCDVPVEMSCGRFKRQKER